MSFSLCNSSQKLPFFAVLVYALYGDPGYFKFKRKDQQYGPCFQTIFTFLMTMEKLNNFIADIVKNVNIPQYEDHLVKTDNIDDPILRV